MGNDMTKQRTRTDAPSEFPQDDPAELEGFRALARRLREDPEADLFQPGIRIRLGPVIVVSAPMARMLQETSLPPVDPQAEVPAPDC